MKMSNEELKEVLRLHQMWINNDDEGKIAELRDADLSDADLRGADLSYADLNYADLRGAKSELC